MIGASFWGRRAAPFAAWGGRSPSFTKKGPGRKHRENGQRNGRRLRAVFGRVG